MNTTQKEQLYLLRAKGLSYTKIAIKLGLSENTVKSFCRRNNLEKGFCEPSLGNFVTQHLCKNCGTELQQRKGSKQKIFCCSKCRLEWWNTHPEAVDRKAVYELVCTMCGNTFESYGNKSRKFCSHPCYIKGRFGNSEV